ncbi:hypothetical protein NH26_12540 [Flammeovirga pacifica]|uniref:Yip1 domain-containing protein n=1 Tax=Flammeovirga pacifica TaxID=915059 RepID=A0A1S1Z1G8_FLAPC|nr:hypothetical protein NH26_12540 [Flammeovirga pacifica]
MLFSWVLQFVSNEMIISDEVWYTTYGEQLSLEQIDGIIEWNATYWWFSYLITPIILLIKVLLITFSLIIGGILFDISLSFFKTIGIVLITEFIFLIPSAIQLTWFTFFENIHSLNDLISFTPWNVFYYINKEDVLEWFIYPLSLINFFEILFVSILTYLVRRVLIEKTEDQNKAFKIVAYGYGSGLVTWVVFITFLSIQYT